MENLPLRPLEEINNEYTKCATQAGDRKFKLDFVGKEIVILKEALSGALPPSSVGQLDLLEQKAFNSGGLSAELYFITERMKYLNSEAAALNVSAPASAPVAEEKAPVESEEKPDDNTKVV